MLINGLKECPCKGKKCKRHGKCEECIAHHLKHNKPPFCMREENNKLS